MTRAGTRAAAIILALLVTGCSSGGGMFAPKQAALSPEQEAQEDQRCQSDGYQLNTPAYQYCRGELARQRSVAEVDVAAPPLMRMPGR